MTTSVVDHRSAAGEVADPVAGALSGGAASGAGVAAWAGRVGPVDRAGIEQVLDLLPRLKAWRSAPGGPGPRHLRAARGILEWLVTHPGEGWQQRWEASGANAGLGWLDALTSGTARSRDDTIAGLRWLMLARVVLPGYDFLSAYRANLLLVRARAQFDPDGFARVEQAGRERGVAGYALSAGVGLLTKLVLHTGVTLAELSAADFAEVRAWSHERDSRAAKGTLVAWDLLAATTGLRGERLEPWHGLRYGQRSPAQLIDRHGLACRPVRDVIVRYLEERRHGVDHSTLIGLANMLGQVFWADLEAHHPGIDSLRLSREVIEAWMHRLETPLASGRPRTRLGRLDVLVTVRAFYLDIAEWAIEDPSWVEWVAPSPIHRRDVTGRKKYRAAIQAAMHQRVRDRLPQLPLLVDTAHQQHQHWSGVLDAARDTPVGAEFTAAGARWRRSTRPGLSSWTTQREITVIVTDLATGAVFDAGRCEDDTFWSWAIIETLRHTGIRIEELLELTELALISYRMPTTAAGGAAQGAGGEVVPLLQIVPSKAAEERLLLISPELASVLASVLMRLRRGNGGRVPVTARWDSHERVESPALPHLFQRRRGPIRHAVFSRGTIYRLLGLTVAAAGLRDQTGGPLKITPHDFRRMFATEAVIGGLPVHIAARVLGHHNLATTQAYLAVFQDDLIRAYRSYLDRRRAMRPAAEYREPTDAEWAEFQQHFELRKLELGTCGRPYGTPCPHEHACIRCPMLRVDPGQRPRLVEVVGNLVDRIDEARLHGWLGEIEGLQVHLTAGRAKLAALDRAARSAGPTVTDLGIPVITEGLRR